MSNQKHQYKDIGGQAVMEGVMMQSPSDESIAIAVRRPNGRIMVTCKHNEPLSKKHKWMGLPLIRGCVNMVVMLKMGMETLDKSTQMLGVMEEEPSKFEKWLAEKLGASIEGNGQPLCHQPFRRIDAHRDSGRLYDRDFLRAGYQARVHVPRRGA